MKINIEDSTTEVHLFKDSKKADLEVKTEDLYFYIIKELTPWAPIGVLPPRLIWISDDHSTVIMERPPFVADMEFHYGKQGQAEAIGVTNYKIPIPWTVSRMMFDTASGMIIDFRMFARNKPVVSMDDKLYVLPIPNMSASAECCMGPGFLSAYREPFDERIKLAQDAGMAPDVTIAERIQHAMNLFWQATFNMDYSWTEPYKMPQNIPDTVAEEQRAEVKALRFLEWWQKQTLLESTEMPYRISNTMGYQEDTVRGLTFDASRTALAKDHALARRALARIPRVSL